MNDRISAPEPPAERLRERLLSAHLDENLKAALEEIIRLKPSSSKGRYIQKGAVSTTFGPGIPLDVNAL